jgi:HAD superfamily hydrolase (TIGR01509 family)
VTIAPYDAIVFDLDGTLIDTETLYGVAFMTAAADCGYTVPASLYASLVGLASPERVERLRRAFGAEFPTEAFLARYYAHRTAGLPQRIPVCAGAVPLLRQLDVPKAVATSASRRTASAHLDRAGLAMHFEHVVTRDDVPQGKPAPDSYLLAADLLGVAPENCLAVEDSPIGVSAAHAAGMQVVMVTRRATLDARQRCVAVLESLDLVARLLQASGADGRIRRNTAASPLR